MKYRKIRGHRKRQKSIENWRLENLNLRWDLVKKYDFDNIDIVVHPWCDISIVNSAFPEPTGKTKQLMLNGLIDIYNSWEKQLDKTEQPYYLKIWLYEPRFSKSQVVCAIGNRIDYYENLFATTDEKKPLRTSNFGHLSKKLDEFVWTLRIDEDHFENDFVGESGQYLTINEFMETKRWFDKMMKKPHRTTELGNSMEYYSFRKGNVWIGEIKDAI